MTCVIRKPPPNKEAVLSALRTDKLLTPKTKVVFARWDQKSQQWRIVLVHASGLRTYWETDATALAYSGGSQKPSWYDEEASAGRTPGV